MTISTNFYTTNNQLLNLPHNTNFRGNPVSIPQNKHDTVEIQGKIKTVQEYIDNLTNKKIIERLYKNEN